MNKKTILVGYIVLLAFVITGCENTLYSVQTSTNKEMAQTENKELETAEVTDVVDGDTIKVMIENEKYTLRMIGVDTPESVHPDKSKNTVYGEKASEYTKSQFQKGQIVYLQKDVSDTDKYGRLLRYIWLEPPTDTEDPSEIRTKMFNALIIADGYANGYQYKPDTKLYELFSQIEFEAATEGIGLWAENGLNNENIKQIEKKEEKIKEINGEYAYIGNKNTKKFHLPFCSGLPKEENSVYFHTKEEALESGYDSCSKCNP